ncbi:glycosyltransferase [candidate division WOR-3 bacterium]|uniref:Glycosyltransferase n=1 Tax=candidate division WOR-3 bacterium TaxID=2052148 RepID=A0A9D5K8A4_UNCW3|nr:glycosyltransferase [candidate division WOR-3 bacterium]MBD3364147.1 glycosyltransferase [candidate division WOR-3 bacterium]
MYKVLFLASFFPAEREPLAGLFIKKHAQAAARYADQYVLSVRLVADLDGGAFDLKVVKENGLKIVKVRCKTVRSLIPKLSYIIDLVRYFRGSLLGYQRILKIWGKPDIVHLNVSWPAGFLALYLSIMKKIPYILSEHWSGYVAQTGSFKAIPVFVKRIIRLIFKRAKVVTAVSGYLSRSLVNHRLVRRNPRIVPNVVQIPEEPGRKTKPKRIIRALTVSLLHDESKNLSGLINAFKGISRKYPDVRLDILGDGQDRDMLINLARNLGLLNRRVFFQGYVPNDQLHEWFQKANFFVLNSNYETFSVATAEAIVHGVPVVLTRCGGPEEFVNEDVGILVDKKDIKDLTEGLIFMVNNWQKYDRLKLNNYIKRMMSPDIVGRRFLRIYEEVLKG